MVLSAGTEGEMDPKNIRKQNDMKTAMKMKMNMTQGEDDMNWSWNEHERTDWAHKNKWREINHVESKPEQNQRNWNKIKTVWAWQ